jgi:hypothetical protein
MSFINRIRDAKMKEKEEEKNKVIEVDSNLLDEIFKTQYFSKKKGRALFNMDFNKIKAPKRKRKMIDLFAEDAELEVLRRVSDSKAQVDEEEKEKLIEEELNRRLTEDQINKSAQSDKRFKDMQIESDHKNSELGSKFSYNELIHTPLSPDQRKSEHGKFADEMNIRDSTDIYSGKKSVVVGRSLMKFGEKGAFKSVHNPFRKDQ